MNKVIVNAKSKSVIEFGGELIVGVCEHMGVAFVDYPHGLDVIEP